MDLSNLDRYAQVFRDDGLFLLQERSKLKPRRLIEIQYDISPKHRVATFGEKNEPLPEPRHLTGTSIPYWLFRCAVISEPWPGQMAETIGFGYNGVRFNDPKDFEKFRLLVKLGQTPNHMILW